MTAVESKDGMCEMDGFQGIRPGEALTALLMLALISGCQQREEDLAVSGRVESDQIEVGSKTGGRIEGVLPTPMPSAL